MGRTASTPSPAVVELPVQVGLAGKDRAGVTAAHGDHNIAGLDGVSGQDLGPLVGDVDPYLVHCLDRGGVNSVGGDAAGGPDLDGVTCQDGEEAGGHL